MPARRLIGVLVSIVLVLIFTLSLSVAHADSAADFDIDQGHFYTQGSGTPAGKAPTGGYSLTDDGGIPMWTEFQRLGGVDALGYPVSGRFLINGRVAQLTQRVGLVWYPEANQVRLLNIFTLLHNAGKDGWLLTKGIPATASWPDEAGKTWQDISQKRYKLLDANPAIRTAYFGIEDPVNMYGLPTSNWLDTPLSTVLRFDNVVFQQWKQLLPWASPGLVQLANGGDLLKESGILGSAPFALQPTPPQTLQAVPAGFALASFYADYFQGRHMSDGRIFSQGALTAASNNFPLGVRLRLSTPDGKRSIVVLNEDHPAAWNSRIDLSKAAFQALYPLSTGIGTVKVEVIQSRPAK